jgi:peptidoglycan/LPS O-acetylase OafA/YrhL
MDVPKTVDSHKNSFDVVRLIAALAVVFGHYWEMVFGSDPLNGFFGTDEDIGGLAVLMFFGISGYLIAESILNGATLRFYAASRLLRIYPALLVCLLVCIFAGMFLTRASLSDYFSAQTSQFFLGNIFPFFWQEQRVLPRVFTAPWNAMNGPLWTIKYELACYVVTLGVFLFPQAVRRYAFAVLCVVALCLWLAPVDSWALPSGGRVLKFEYFNMGFFRYYAAIFFLAAAARIVVKSPRHWMAIFLVLSAVLVLGHGTPIGILALLGTVALAGVAIGCTPVFYFDGFYRKKIGDLSYGTYLYGWPISLICVLWLFGGAGFWPTFFVAVAVTLAVACVSWRSVERPALRLKGRESRIAPVAQGTVAQAADSLANRALAAPADTV